ARRVDRANAQRTQRRARLLAEASWPLRLGRDVGPGEATRRDPRVPARNNGTNTALKKDFITMAVVTIVNEDKTITNADEITSTLATHGIDYERWTPAHPVADNAPPDEILNAYAREIDELKQRGGYVTADVIDSKPQTPDSDTHRAQ